MTPKEKASQVMGEFHLSGAMPRPSELIAMGALKAARAILDAYVDLENRIAAALVEASGDCSVLGDQAPKYCKDCRFFKVCNTWESENDTRSCWAPKQTSDKRDNEQEQKS